MSLIKFSYFDGMIIITYTIQFNFYETEVLNDRHKLAVT